MCFENPVGVCVCVCVWAWVGVGVGVGSLCSLYLHFDLQILLNRILYSFALILFFKKFHSGIEDFVLNDLLKRDQSKEGSGMRRARNHLELTLSEDTV